MTGKELLRRLHESLEDAPRKALDEAIAAAARASLSLYLVGGPVRDLFLGAKSLDLDLAVEGDALTVAGGVAAATGGRVVAHPRFGTASVRGAGFRVDLASARGETYERPGALPRVEPAAIEDDLARRDFTINAMAVRLTEPAGELLDPFGGAADLEAKKIRVLHDRSFQDDATRMLRAARYAARLGFEIDAGTQRLIRRDLSYLDTVSGARLRQELVLTFREQRSIEAVVLLQRLGILAAVHPSLALDDTVVLPWREAVAGERLADVAELGFCLLCRCEREADADSVSRRLHLTGAIEGALRDFVRARDAFAKLAPSGAPPSLVVETLEPLRPAAVWAAGIVEGGAAKTMAESFLRHWRRVRPILRGDDLLALGVAPGPEVGRAMRQLRAAKLDGRVEGRRQEEEFVRRLAGGKRE